MFCFNSKIGKLYIEEKNNKIIRLSFFKIQGEEKETELIKETCNQLSEYFEGTRKYFNLPINPQGTIFQKKVWKELTKIPYGQTRSYKDIAHAIGNPKAYRAVGMANNKNPITIIIPCHRVIGKNGKLTGYAGGLDLKRFLLTLENKNTTQFAN